MNIQSTTQFQSTPLILPTKGIVSVSVSDGPRKTSQALPKGAQGKLIDAAILAEKMGYPINLVTTIRTEQLLRSSLGIFNGRPEADTVSGLFVLMRKWHTNRGIPWNCIWSREVGRTVGSHLHMGTHQSKNHIEEYIDQLAEWTGEKRVFLDKHKPGNIGFSENKRWLVQCCMRRGHSGPDVGAYLGKDEPNWTLSAWGVRRENKLKRVTHQASRSGFLEGTTRSAYRYGTSRNIAPLTAKGKSILENVSDSDRLFNDLSWLPY